MALPGRSGLAGEPHPHRPDTGIEFAHSGQARRYLEVGAVDRPILLSRQTDVIRRIQGDPKPAWPFLSVARQFSAGKGCHVAAYVGTPTDKTEFPAVPTNEFAQRGAERDALASVPSTAIATLRAVTDIDVADLPLSVPSDREDVQRILRVKNQALLKHPFADINIRDNRIWTECG